MLLGTIITPFQNVSAAFTGVPKLLKISDAVKPGKVISISGEGIKAAEIQVSIKLDIDGNSPSIPPGDAIGLGIITEDSKGHFVVVAFPDNATPGIYNVWVKNDVGWSAPIKLNAPRGMFMSEKEAWNGLGIEVVGRNFDGKEFSATQRVKVRLINVSDGTTYDMTSSITRINPYCVTFTIGSQPLSTYNVEVSNDNGIHWSGLTSGQTLTLVPVGSDPLGIGVAWAGSFNWDNKYDVTNFNVKPNSGEDETADLQSAINAASNAGGGVVYFPNGTYHLTQLRLRPHVVLKGESTDGTNLVYCGTNPLDIVISGSDDGISLGSLIGHMGVANLKITLLNNDNRPDRFFWMGHAYEPFFMDAWTNRTAGKMFVVNTKINYPYDTRKKGKGEGFVMIARERVLMNNNHWVGYGAVPNFMVVGEYHTEKNNSYEYSDRCSSSTASYAFRENNILQGHREVDGDVAHGYPEAQLSGMYFKDRTYLSNNTVKNVGTLTGNDGEAFSDDIALGYWNDGNVMSSTTTSITCKARNPAIPLVFPARHGFSEPSILIIDGMGMGQLREITTINENIANVTPAWDIQPDTTSKWTLIMPIREVTLYKNTVVDATTSYQMYGNGIDWVIADNTSENALGVFIWNMRQPNNALMFRTGVIPNYYNRIVRNRLKGKDFEHNDQGIVLSGERYNTGAYNEVQGFNTEIRENVISGAGDASGNGITIAPGRGENDSLGVTGDITNTIIEGNTFKKLAAGIALVRNCYGQTLVNNTFESTVQKAFVTDGVSQNTITISDTNYSTGKMVSASASVADHGPENAIDISTSGVDERNSKWATTLSGDNWLKVDLGKNHTINRWVVKHAGAGDEDNLLNTINFKLQKSTHGSKWTDVDIVTGNNSLVTDRTITPFTERYARLYITNAGADGNSRIYEFELRGGSNMPMPKYQEIHQPRLSRHKQNEL